jgi:type II secretory pathway pseudopilin PulG
MRNSAASAGFTIVETLIVLAITGMLFVAIIVTMGGRQSKAQFLQATKDIQSQMQSTINDVASGTYPSSGDYSCTKVGSSVSFSATPSEQGTNQDCVFLGKVVQFKVGSTDPEPYNVYTVAALRSCDTNLSCTDMYKARPTVISAANVNVTETSALKYGLTTKSVKAGGTSVGAVAFLSELGSLGEHGSYNSGAQPVDVVLIKPSTLGVSKSQMITAINASLHSNPTGWTMNPSSGVAVCFQSGSTDQTALMTIGSNGHDLSVKIEVEKCT